MIISVIIIIVSHNPFRLAWSPQGAFNLNEVIEKKCTTRDLAIYVGYFSPFLSTLAKIETKSSCCIPALL